MENKESKSWALRMTKKEILSEVDTVDSQTSILFLRERKVIDGKSIYDEIMAAAPPKETSTLSPNCPKCEEIEPVEPPPCPIANSKQNPNLNEDPNLMCRQSLVDLSAFGEKICEILKQNEIFQYFESCFHHNLNGGDELRKVHESLLRISSLLKPILLRYDTVRSDSNKIRGQTRPPNELLIFIQKTMKKVQESLVKSDADITQSQTTFLNGLRILIELIEIFPYSIEDRQNEPHNQSMGYNISLSPKTIRERQQPELKIVFCIILIGFILVGIAIYFN